MHEIDRFVVETFENRPSKVLAGIDYERGRTEFTRNCTRSTGYQARKRFAIAVLENELRAEERHDVAHINVPPISANCESLDPFRAVPFLALGKVNFEAVEAGEVPCGAGERHPHFLVNTPNIAVHP